jgi:Ubinuclein conserved middle domain
MMDVDKSADGEGKDARDTRDVHPPAKKYKMTEMMKGLIWNLVCLSNECCRIENEKKYVPRIVHMTNTWLICYIFPLARWKALHRKSANKACVKHSTRKLSRRFLRGGCLLVRYHGKVSTLVVNLGMMTDFIDSPVSVMKKKFEKEAMESES